MMLFKSNPRTEEVNPMEANEAQELQENAEHAEHAKSLRPVALTMTVLAVLVAVVTVLGHRTHTEAILNQTRAAVEQNRASDQWAYYQAHKIRDHATQLAANELSVLAIADKDKAKKLASGYADDQAKWKNDLKDEQDKAQAFEDKVKQAEEKVDEAEARADRFDLGEALLEIGLVITSVTLLTRTRAYWYIGLGFSVIGIVAAVMGVLLK
jgi:hypothetical protein